MADVVVLIPVLNRPGNAPRVVASLRASGADARPLFLISPHDRAERVAVKATGADLVVVDWQPGHGDYARKINLGCRITREQWVFQGADDLEFQPGWFDACLAAAAQLRRDDVVVGTNDDANPTVKRGLHSTHSLVARAYLAHGTIDEPGKMLHEGYRHGYIDNELMGTAKSRGAWVFARDAHVTHRHPLFDRTVERDSTYEKALDPLDSRLDLQLFRQRERLWSGRRSGRARGSRAGV